MSKFTFDTGTALFAIANESSYVNFYNTLESDLSAFGIATEAASVKEILSRFWNMVKQFFKNLMESVRRFFTTVFGNTDRIMHTSGANRLLSDLDTWSMAIVREGANRSAYDAEAILGLKEFFTSLLAKVKTTYKDILTLVTNNAKPAAYSVRKKKAFDAVTGITVSINQITDRLEKTSMMAAADPSKTDIARACQSSGSAACAVASAIIKTIAETIVLIGYDSRKGFGGGFAVEIVDT